MEPHQIEAWALHVIERLAKGQPIEDDRVELKTDWLEPPKAARQIAAHANAARGAAILWLIGVDEKTRTVPGARHAELANWWPAVQAQFDGLAPDLQGINVPSGSVTVTALYIETTRAPFVVRNPMHGHRKDDPIAFEVPWREGTRVRTAGRSELLTMLSPLQRLPAFDFLDGELTANLRAREGEAKKTLIWWLNLGLYVNPHSQEVVIPFHRCRVTAETPKPGPRRLSMVDISLSGPTRFAGLRGPMLETESASLTIQATEDEVLIGGPGRLYLHAAAQTEPKRLSHEEPVRVVVELRTAEADEPSVLEVLLPPVDPQRDEVARWQVYRKLHGKD